MTSHRQTDHLRVLIAEERKDRLALVARIVAELGHEGGVAAAPRGQLARGAGRVSMQSAWAVEAPAI